MPETRYIETYKDGVLVSTEPYVVSDRELYFEAIDRGCNDGIHAIKDAYDNWDSLNPTEKREITKDLLRCVILLLRDKL